MGGDGGTISSNRTYLRGAGKACHTADHPSNALKRSKLEDAERARSVLSTCALSGAVLDFSPSKTSGDGGGGSSVSRADTVACPYGKLYRHEKALEALLLRSRAGGGDDAKTSVLGSHIRGMKDLHPVRFHVAKSSSSQEVTGGGYVATCPITGSEIASGNVPCFLIVRSKSKDKKKSDDDDEVARNPNVLSERAIKEMGIAGLQAEYGPFDEGDMIRLAPPRTGGVFEHIRKKWEARMEEEQIAKLKKKKEKKRKRGSDDKSKRIQSSSPRSTKSSVIRQTQSCNTTGGRINSTTKRTVVEEARSTVQSAVAQNPVLSNLFGTGKNSNKSEKQKKVDLFTRNC